jgi:hypothetical protein
MPNVALAQRTAINELYGEPVPIPGLGSAERSFNLKQSSISDLTNDGKPDVAFSATEDAGFNGVAPLFIFLSNEEGTLESGAESIIAGGVPSTDRGFRQILPADFNGDGRMDLFLESHGSEPDCGDGTVNCWIGGQNSLLLSNGDGLLENVTLTNLPSFSDFSHGSALGDFDGDGDIEIWVNNLGGSPLYNPGFSYLLDNNGIGNLSVIADVAMPWEIPITGRNEIFPEDLSSGFWSFTVDANGDGHPDLGLGWEPILEKNIVLMNDGTGRFQLLENEAYPDPPGYVGPIIEHVVVQDISGDGLEDVILHTSNEDWTLTMIQMLISNGDGTFRDETAARLPQEPEARPLEFQFHDLDNDGHPDYFANVNFEYEDIRINDGEGNFRPIERDWLVGLDWNWVVLDVDGDGGTDFLEGGWQGLALHKMEAPYEPDQDGDENDNRLIGGAHNNLFRGLAGNDVLDGGLGDDELDGGAGNDQLIGGSGNDLMIPGSGSNTIDGGPGYDEIQYGFSINLAEIQLGETTSIRRTNGTVNDQATNAEYAHFTDASIPLPTMAEYEIPGLNGVAGLWYDPSLDGEGFNVIATPSGTVLFFYGYTANGERLWLISETFAGDIGFEQVLDLIMYEGTGGTFAQPAPSAEALNEWGKVNALFDACGSGRLALNGNDGIKATYQIKLAGIADANCEAKQLSAPSGLAGLWYDAALDGEGYNVIITNGSTVFFFYGYDQSGERLWLISETLTNVPVLGTTETLTVYAASGGTFDAPKPSAEALSEWGSLQVTFNTCTEATATLSGTDGDKTSNLIKLAGITDSTCP